MSWIGYDEWEPPAGYIDVPEVWPVWEQEGSLILFFVGRTMEDITYKVFSQRVEVNVTTGALTPDDTVNLIDTLDDRFNWHILDVQRLDNGGFAVQAKWTELISG